MNGGVTILHEPAQWSLTDLARHAAEPLQAVGVRYAVAFGSYARGGADAWSDLDLLVVIDTDLPRFERGRLFERLYDALPVSLDLLIYTPLEFERGSSAGLGVFDAIAAEGKPIFPMLAESASASWPDGKRALEVPGHWRTMNSPYVTARRWLDTANEDLAVARHTAASDFHAHACFFAHQVAEKAVKALHYARGARSVLGHGVRHLMERLDPPALVELLPEARELDLFYIPTRYPSGLDDGTPGEAFSAEQSSRAIDFAESIVTATAALIDAPPR